MNELATELFIVAMYLGTMLGMCVFLGVVCRLGDLGFWIIGWIDSKLQEMPERSAKPNETSTCDYLKEAA